MGAPRGGIVPVYLVKIGGGSVDRWDTGSIAQSSGSVAGDDASTPFVSLAADLLGLVSQYVPDSCVVPSYRRGGGASCLLIRTLQGFRTVSS